MGKQPCGDGRLGRPAKAKPSGPGTMAEPNSLSTDFPDNRRRSYTIQGLALLPNISEANP